MKTISLIILSLVLTSCASLGDDAPGCHGKRRPANPQGSVLAPGASQAPVPAAGKGGCP